MGPPLPEGVRPGGRYDEWRPARPRLLVADVDGTLIGPHPHATDRVAQAVARAQQAGLRVGFATGRMRLAVEALADQLDATGPHVLHNGAEVRSEGTTLAAWPLDRRQVEQLVGLCADRGWYAELYTEDGYVVTRHDERFRPHWSLLGHEPLDVGGLDPGETVYKATLALFEEDADLHEVEAAVRDLGLVAGSAGSPLTPEITYVNATHPDADKGRALAHAATEIGLEAGEVVAVGDGRNDLTMLAWAGTAIAMGQAVEEVQAAAHLVVPEVAEDGVAHALDATLEWSELRA